MTSMARCSAALGVLGRNLWATMWEILKGLALLKPVAADRKATRIGSRCLPRIDSRGSSIRSVMGRQSRGVVRK